MAAVLDWRAVFSRVRGALRHRGCTSQDAEDLIHDAYLKLVSHQQGHEVSRPDAFLMRIALNLAMDAHRARRSRGGFVWLDERAIELTTIADPSPTTEQTVLARERIARLNERMAELNTRTRDIYLAHLIDGLSHAEIAAAHGISVSAVEKHMAKATTSVTRWMEGW